MSTRSSEIATLSGPQRLDARANWGAKSARILRVAVSVAVGVAVGVAAWRGRPLQTVGQCTRGSGSARMQLTRFAVLAVLLVLPGKFDAWEGCHFPCKSHGKWQRWFDTHCQNSYTRGFFLLSFTSNLKKIWHVPFFGGSIIFNVVQDCWNSKYFQNIFSTYLVNKFPEPTQVRWNYLELGIHFNICKLF